MNEILIIEFDRAGREAEQRVRETLNSMIAEWNASRQQTADLRRSWNYRIGATVTGFLRKCRGMVLCCREHGFKYKVERILEYADNVVQKIEISFNNEEF